MQFDEFISKVGNRSGLDRRQTEALTRATLETLAARITGGEADDLAAQLPEELKGALLSYPGAAEAFDRDEFVRRVAQHAGLTFEEAERTIPAVFTTLSEAVTPGEFEDVVAQLPKDYRELMGIAALRAR